MTKQTYSRALLPPGEGGPQGRMRDHQYLNIPHPSLRGTLSRRERDARIRIAPSVLALLICVLFSAVFLGQSRGRPQTFEGTITLPSRNAGRPDPPASLAGTVVSEATGEPLAGATVKMSRHFGSAVLALLAEGEGATAIAPVRTDNRGGFSFSDVVAGSYDLTIELDGYLSRTIGKRTDTQPVEYVTLAAGQRVNDVRVGLSRSARIDGHIRNETGKLLSGIPLHLIREDPSGLRLAQAAGLSVAQATTAADGSYELKGFLPGQYVLIAGSPSVFDTAHPQSFATKINIADSEAQSLDFALDSRGGYAIRGGLSLGIQAADMSLTVFVVSPTGSAFPSRLGIPYKYSPQNGSFEVPGLFPGLYEIRANTNDPQGCVSTTVVVSGGDVTGIEMALKQCI